MNFGQPQQQRPSRNNPNQDALIENSTNDLISSLNFSPTANFLVSTSWDGEVRVFEVQQMVNKLHGIEKAKKIHYGPALCSAWNMDGTKIFSGSCDNSARCWDIQSNKFIVSAIHQGPVNDMSFLTNYSLLCTSSWDKTVKYWDFRQQQRNPLSNIMVSERVSSIDSFQDMLVVMTYNNEVHCIDLRKPNQITETKKTPFKLEARSIALMKHELGFAAGGADGRVTIEYFNSNNKNANYTFRCHRENQKDVYSVNTIAWHPTYCCLATCGSDGSFHFWQTQKRSRLKQSRNLSVPISCCCWNSQGYIFAYAASYDWSQGINRYNQNDPGTIYLHLCTQNEVSSVYNKS